MYNQFTEQEIRSFLREAPRPNFFKVGLIAIIALSLLSAATYAGMAFRTEDVATAQIVTLPITPASGEPSTEVAAVVPTTPIATPIPVTLPTNTISAGDVKISAPVTWNVPFNEKDMNNALRNGVIHIAGTSVPGEKGMAAIAGHSSNYPWIKGDFNSIFASLTKSKLGQQIEINFNGVMYQYQIDRIYEVKPSDVTILGDNRATGIRLITCVPVGTSLRRLIVEAVQINPDQSGNIERTANAFTGGQLPSGR